MLPVCIIYRQLREAERLELHVYLALLLDSEKAGGKISVQGNSYYVHLRCHIESTDVKYMATSLFIGQ